MCWNLATLEDSPLLARLNLELIADAGHQNPMNLLERSPHARRLAFDGVSCRVFQRTERVVAYAVFRDDEWSRTYLRQFFVVRDARRQGVGRAAMELFKREVVAAGTSVVLEVLTTNAVGRAFWAATGFASIAWR